MTANIAFNQQWTTKKYGGPRRRYANLCCLLFALVFNASYADARVQREIAPWRIHERVIEFSIEENCPLGTELGTVAITAATTTTAATPKYKFGSPSKLFAVDPQTGRITTTAPIDAESLCQKAREHESGGVPPNELKLKARSTEESLTDHVTCNLNGQLFIHLDVNAVMPDASLRAVHRVSVRVNDLNDNWPIFEQIRWHKRLKEMLYRKGRRFNLPKAKDADILEEYSRVLYRLEASEENSGSPEVPFRLEVGANGQPGLVLTEDLDAEHKTRHQFTLVAYSPTPIWVPSADDWHSPRTSKPINQGESRLEIDIEVADMNDNEPRFDSASYNVSVAEDTLPGTVIFQLLARDADSTAQLVYSMGASAEGTVMSSTFTVESDGQVRLRSFLDYELRHTYKVPVRVNDGEFTAQAHLFVHVLDVNDESPEFEVNPLHLVADENAEPGKLIGRVRIRDPDGEAVNGKVQCWEPQESKGNQVLSFIPDPSTNPTSSVYDLTTRLLLDREAILEPSRGRLLVYLICSDGHGFPENERSIVKRTATMTATLTVRDDNDHPPVFSHSVYHVDKSENNAIGEKIIQVNATDADEGDNARVTYALLDRTNFRVDSLTGWITANAIFDREKRDSYQVTVIAMDQGKPRLSASTLLNLTILDSNDNPPQLFPHEDDDWLNVVNQIHHQTGRIGQRNLFAVRENLPTNSYIGDVLARDDDLGVNAELHFSIAHEIHSHYSTRFQMLSNGSLYTNTELDREEKERYRLTICVADRSPINPLTTTGAISIIVLDENDNSPIFTQPEGLLSTNTEKENGSDKNVLYDQPSSSLYSTEKSLSWQRDGLNHRFDRDNLQPSVRLSMHEKPGHVITTLHAKDSDIGQNGRIVYEMMEVRHTSKEESFGVRGITLFRVKSNDGDVVLLRPMSVNDLGFHVYEVSAADNGEPNPRRDSKIMIVQIEDVPSTGNPQHKVMTSSYFTSNRTKVAFDAWGFEGRSNVFIITVLAGVSGLLACVLITSVVCVVGPCSKARGGFCCSHNQRRNPGPRPITSPGCSEAETGYMMNGTGPETNGNLRHYRLAQSPERFNGTQHMPPSGGVDPTLLLQEDWQLTCAQNGCFCADSTYPYRHTSAADSSPLHFGKTDQLNIHVTASQAVNEKDLNCQSARTESVSLVYENIPIPDPGNHLLNNQVVQSYSKGVDGVTVRVLAGPIEDEHRWTEAGGKEEVISLPRSANPSGILVGCDTEDLAGRHNLHTFRIAKPIPIQSTISCQTFHGFPQIRPSAFNSPTQYLCSPSPTSVHSTVKHSRHSPLHNFADQQRVTPVWLSEEQTSDSGRGCSDEELTLDGCGQGVPQNMGPKITDCQPTASNESPWDESKPTTGVVERRLANRNRSLLSISTALAATKV